MTTHWRRAGTHLSWLLLTVPTFAIAQTPDMPRLRPPVDPSAVRAEPFTLPKDLNYRKKLEATRDYIRDRDWDQTVKLLQTVLDAREDSFYRQEAKDHWTSTRAEAERMLGALPPEARKHYNATFNPQAQKLLADARARNDLAAVSDVVRRFRFTSAGAEALGFLGAVHLDRGRFDLAAACYQRLLTTLPPEKTTPAVLFGAALAFRGAGANHREVEAWAALSRSAGPAGVRLKDKLYPVEQLRRDKATKIASGEDANNWLLFRGSAARTGQASGDVPLLTPRFRVTAVENEQARRWIETARGPAANATGLLPMGMPLALGDRLVFRGAGGVRALDTRTGKEVCARRRES